MMGASRWAAGVAALFMVQVAGAEGGSPRLRIRFDDNWKFLRGPEQAPSSGEGPFHWQWRPAAVSKLDTTTLPSDLDGGDWRNVHLGENTLRGRLKYAWYRTEIGSGPIAGRVLHFESVDDNAAVFLNGKRLMWHSGYGDPFDVSVEAAWNPQGTNHLVVLVENTDGEGGINGGVDFLPPPPPTQVPPEAKSAFPDRAWRTVHLPHDYVVEGTFRQGEDVSHGSLPRPTAWYRKTFTAPAEYRGKSVWIDFDGVYRNSTVYLNGERLGTQASGYIGFRYDIGAKLKYGQPNTLAVYTDPTRDEGWWYEGGGIYRHVWLNVADPVHVAPWGTFVRSDVMGNQAKLTIQTNLVGEGGVRSEVIAPNGRKVLTINGAGTQTGMISNPALWSLEKPQRYRLVTSVLRNGKVVDRVETPFGIRTIAFDKDKGFFLNGKPVKIQGTCNHQDHAGVGTAMPDGLLEWRLRRLKDMECNAYRCSHNPPASELLDACDRLGILIMDETRHLGDTTLPKTPKGTKADDLSELKSMVLRDRNHPSIIIWSLYNEEPIQGSAEGAEIFRKMRAVVDQLDGTRPSSGANNFAYERGTIEVTKLFGFNYNIGKYDETHARFPELPMYGSETASTVSTRGIYANDPVKGYVSAYDVNFPGWAATAEAAWKPIGERPWMAGGFVWTGFDYKGEPTPYGWPCINSHFGILDICGFPKDNFYWYKAWWGTTPVVHVLPHWNWSGQEGKPINVWVHSNADQVELFLNGKSLGRKPMPRYGHLEWNVPYTSGRLEARGYRGSATIAKDVVETTGAPVAIRLKTTVRSIVADEEDLSPIEVELVDAQGRVVPMAGNPISFSVQGPAKVVGVGNGDPSSHEPDKASQRNAFNGYCMALVGAATAKGEVRVTASSPGLRSATLTLKVK